MVSKKLVIINKLGLHARPANNFVKEAGKYKCDVTIKKAEKTCNAKSLISILGGCIKYGTEIELVCNGVDEAEALEKLSQMIESGLGE